MGGWMDGWVGPACPACLPDLPALPACSLKTHLADPRQQAMYAVVHGGLSLELRQQSIDYLASLPFDGMAVGGSLGKNRRARG